MVSRSCAQLVESLSVEIRQGAYAAGQFVPSARKLSARYGVSPETARRGLKALQAKGLLVAEPSRGFRVATQSKGQTDAQPVAFATDYLADLSDAEPTSWALSNAVQKAAAVKGWSALGAHAGSGDLCRVLEQVISVGAWGVILDSLDPEYYQSICRAKLPVVMVNSVLEGERVDSVVQDNYSGGYQAAGHLVATGAKRVGWFGPVRRFGHTRERHAGATAGLAAEGRALAVETSMSKDLPEDELRVEARKFLEGQDRPDGILAFDLDSAKALMKVAGELDLVPEKDFWMVGWLVEECLASDYALLFRGESVSPVVTWRASSMAEWALKLLSARRAGEGGEPVRVNIPTALKLEGHS